MKLMNLIRETQRKCGMWLNVYIPYMVKKGKWEELEDLEKREFVKGVKDRMWDKKGNHLKDNNPYKKKTNKLNEDNENE
jgi:hypothetical protein